MAQDGDAFMIARGAPFYELQERLGLLSDKAQTSRRRVAVFLCLTAGVPIGLGLVEQGGAAASAMLFGPIFLSRFVLFIGICFLMEASLEKRVHGILERFDESGILTERGRRDGAALTARALILRDSGLAEFLCLGLAVTICVISYDLQVGRDADPPIWLARTVEDRHVPTAAGWWVITVSGLVFWFLLVRWFWRAGVAGWLLAQTAFLEMRLVATHPDKSGGIGFAGIYPNCFAPFVFALSSVVAASIYGQLASQDLDIATYGKAMAIWLAVMIGLFSLPMLAFALPLGALKQTTIAQADRLATLRERRSERTVFGSNIAAAEDPVDDAAADAPAPDRFRKAARELSTVPFRRAALVPITLAALAPLLIAGASQLPLLDLLKAAKGLLIL